jgi:leucyl-tRNA synthetase
VGTGAVVGVPGHDKRDFEFAKTFGLPVKRVIVGDDNDMSEINSADKVIEEGGTVVNSDFLNGHQVDEAISKVIAFAKKRAGAKNMFSYRLRDWVFSRQRYWGEPIPVIHTIDGDIEPLCDPDNPSQVNEALPLVLPDVPDYNPTSDGSSPWIGTKNG